jgi:tripeptidyl-peptidase-1
MRFSSILTFGLLGGALAAPAPQKRHVVHERRDKLPRNWRRDNQLPREQHLPMRIALKQSNLHNAEAFLMDISHPSSPNFGNHWSAKKVAETFAPSTESVNAVIQWLAEAGITSERAKQSQGLNWVQANVTVAEAESLLNTKYYAYTHSESGQTHVACEDYSVPENIREHIDFITPTVHFDAKVVGRPKQKRDLNELQKRAIKRQSTQIGAGHAIGGPNDKSLPKQGAKLSPAEVRLSINALSTCNTAITPDCLRALYDLPTDNVAAPGSEYHAPSTRNFITYSEQTPTVSSSIHRKHTSHKTWIYSLQTLLQRS